MRLETWKKTALFAGIFGASAILLSGCGKSGGNAVKNIGKSGVVSIAVYQAPDLKTDLGKRENELVDTIASGLGASPEYIEASSMEEVQNLLLDGKADLAIGGILDSAEIDDKLVRSDAYAYSDLYVVTRRGDYSDSPEAFSGRTLAFTEDLPESFVSWTKDVDGLKPVYIDSASVSAGLSGEKIDGYVCRLAEAKTITDPDGTVQYQNLIGVESPGYVILMKKSESRLCSGVNTIIGMDLTDDHDVAAEDTTASKGE